MKKLPFGHAGSYLTGFSGLNKLEQDKWTVQLVRFLLPREAEQSSITALGAPFSTPMGLWSPGHKDKQNKVTPLPFLALLLLAVPTWKSTWKSTSEAFAEFTSDLHASCTVPKARIPGIFIKQNRTKRMVLINNPVPELKFQEEQNPALERKANLVVIIHKSIQETSLKVPILSKLAH